MRVSATRAIETAGVQYASSSSPDYCQNIPQLQDSLDRCPEYNQASSLPMPSNPFSSRELFLRFIGLVAALPSPPQPCSFSIAPSGGLSVSVPPLPHPFLFSDAQFPQELKYAPAFACAWVRSGALALSAAVSILGYPPRTGVTGRAVDRSVVDVEAGLAGHEMMPLGVSPLATAAVCASRRDSSYFFF